MADENFQNRLSNVPNRATAPGEKRNDPLAELARLIGQNDPFAEFGRTAQTPAPAQQQPIHSVQPHAAQHIPVLPQQTAADANYRNLHEMPTYAQAPHDIADFRETAYREHNQMPPGSEFYDEPESSGRGRGLMTAAVVIALAVTGIVGAFAYRVVFSGPSSIASPPVIRANPDPTKVPPPVVNAESSQNKLTYERVGDRSQGERVVSREEPPVDAKDLTRPTAGRNQAAQSSGNQWPQVGTQNVPPTSPSPAVTTSAPTTAMAAEPKKVRTVPIRPDPNDASMAPSSLTPPTASAQGNTPAARSYGAPNQVPNAVAAASNQGRPAAAAMTPPQASANVPLALGDDAAPALPRTVAAPQPARQAPVQRQAAAPQPLAVAPRQVAAAPAQVAAAPSGSGFLVQVSAQRSEGEAQTALRAAQAKYPSVLGAQKGTIQRADLGERGTFYRAMIGPFASRDQATQVCTNLKAAGGTCIVQGN